MNLQRLKFVLAIYVLPSIAAASTIDFVTAGCSANGAKPVAGLIEDSGGNFYGTTEYGGLYNEGTIFEVTSAGQMVVLFSFSGGNGAQPMAGLVRDSSGNFYGTTAYGGSVNDGTIFKFTLGGTLSTLVNFNGGNGSNPWSGALLLASDGNFYGTTAYGGSSGNGTIFEVTSAGVLTILFNFNAANGAEPSGPLVQVNGSFYGTTMFGGSSGDGTVFALTPNGATFAETVLVNFNGTNGEIPEGGVIQATDGNFYGTTYSDGTSSYGTVFKVTSGGSLTTLATFNDTIGVNPEAGLIQGSDGDFYGTTSNGGTTTGTVFQMTSAGVIKVLGTFPSSSSGAAPAAPVMQGADGNFYGTSSYGGTSNGNGTVFKVTTKAKRTTVATFTGSSGTQPNSLTLGKDGYFYGTTLSGGTSNVGTVFRMLGGGLPTTLLSFDQTDGAKPVGPLIQGTDGNYYGVTSVGGSSNGGTVYKLTPDLNTFDLSVLVNFTGSNGTNPRGGLLQGSDGNLYGTTFSGGTSDNGIIFVINTSGTLINQIECTNNTAGPGGALIQASDGNYYGTTVSGGSKNFGSVFQLTPGGVLTTIASFNGESTGAGPLAGIIQANNGSFYGTTYGESGEIGTIFQITPDGATFTLENLASPASPNGIMQASDGNFYGTLQGGDGAIFQMTSAGSLNLVNSFSGENGINPNSGVVQGNDGCLYGTTTGDGGNGDGTIFRFNYTSSENVIFANAATIPITSSSYIITGSSLNLALGFAPGPGTILTVVNNVGAGPINGTFTNLADGGALSATYQGVTYTFIANYEGGDGNDLTLSFNPMAPVITSADNFSFTLGQVDSFTATATGNPAPTFSATGLPSWCSLNTATGAITGTPPLTNKSPVTFSLTASNGTNPDSTQTVTLFLIQNYAQWAAQYSLSGGPSDTPQGDGVPNLLKYFADINPTESMASSDRTALPAASLNPAGTVLALSYRENPSITNLTINVQTSSDLVNWTTLQNPTIVPTGTDSSTGDPLMQVQVPVTQSPEFIRLNLTTTLP